MGWIKEENKCKDKHFFVEDDVIANLKPEQSEPGTGGKDE